MITIQENVSLLPFNTFGIDVNARFFGVVRTLDEVQSLIRSDIFKKEKHLIVGGGSNLLLTRDFEGLVVKNELKGIHVVSEYENQIELEVGAGENWHEFVMYCVSKDLGGVENLSLIPGTVGAAPMQNIGAYGVEIKNVIRSVQAVELATGELRSFDKDECQFGYRESIFKHELKNKYFISSITLILTTNHHHFNTTYGAIRDVLKQRGDDAPTLRLVSDAVISIRQSKLPDPAVLGNAGSFFKNPSIAAEQLASLQKSYPQIPSFSEENGLFKIPAAWLIEQCGWKGKRLEDIGVHQHQALVLVNYGGGRGSDIWQLAMTIQESVREKFSITLQAEVNVI
jgi:UDP-N-acetylmuramate dehydrogenase